MFSSSTRRCSALICFLVVTTQLSSHFLLVNSKGGRGGGGGGRGGSRGFGSRRSSSGTKSFGFRGAGTRFHSSSGWSFRGGGYIPSYHSHQMQRPINHNYKVCTDFYNHACGSWSKMTNSNTASTHSVPEAQDQYSLLQSKIDYNIWAMLRSNPEQAFDVQLLHLCFHRGLSDDFQPLASLLEQIGQKWPILDQQSAMGGSSWYSIYAELVLLNINPFFEVAVKHGEIISLQAPYSTVNWPDSSWSIYEKLAKGVAFLFAKYDEAESSGPKTAWEQMSQQIQDMVHFEAELTFLQSIVPLMPFNQRAGRRITLAELKRETGKGIDWTWLLNRIRATAASRKMHSTTNKRATFLTDDDWIAVENIDYFRQIATLIRKTPTQVLHNFLQWKVIFTYHHLVGGELRAIFASYPQIMPPVWNRCSNLVKQIYPWHITRRYIQRFVPNSNQTAVATLVADIKHKFEDILQSSVDSSWLSSSASKQTITKLREMKTVIACPPWLLESDGLSKTNESAFLGDFAKIISQIRGDSFKRLMRNNPNSPIDPLGLKVRYINESNTLVVPFGVMQTPFFNESSPRILNLAALGSLIANEIIYGLRDAWWNSNHFGNDSDCFSRDYRKFLPRSQFNEMFTIEQIIASDLAIRLVDELWKDDYWFYLQRPDMFFLQFAQVYCASNKSSGMLKHQVNFILRNLADFSSFYDCSSSSPMHAQHKCPLFKGNFLSWESSVLLVLVIITSLYCTYVIASLRLKKSSKN